MMLAGLSAWHADHTQIVIVGPADRDDTLALQREVGRRYRPFAVVVPVRPGAGAGGAVETDAVCRPDDDARGAGHGVCLPRVHLSRARGRR